MQVIMKQYSVPQNLAVSESGFLFQANTGESFTLNAIGKEIFAMLQAGMEQQAIIEKLVDEYEIDRQSVEKDFADYVTQLKHYSILIEL